MTVRRRLLTVAGIFAVLLILVPFLWWQFLGPERFEGLELGNAPDGTLSVEDVEVDRDASRLALLAGRDLGEGDGAAVAERVIELPPLDLSPSTRVTLLFSVGSDGMSRRDANRLRVADVGDRGGDKLTDSMMLLVSDAPTGKAALVSIPRDLWLSSRGHRINETFVRRGIQAFVDDVSKVSGLPVHSVVQVNFTAFADLVSAIDGVALQVPVPMADLYSVLYVPQAGCWRFEGADALAYARSRHTLTTTSGGERWRSASSANDISRMARQQALVSAAWDQVRGPGFTKRIPDLLRIADGLTIDRGLGVDDVVALARAFQGVAAGRVEGHILPTLPRTVGRAQVLVINWNRALPFYQRLRSWPPGRGGEAATAPEPAPSASANASAKPSPSPASASPSTGQGSGLDPLDELTGSEKPSEHPSEAPSSSPSEEASTSPAEPAPEPSTTSGPARTDTPSPGSSTPAAAGGCSRANAWELPDNPLDYLAAIANRDPVPTYTPHRRGQSEPDSSDGPAEADDTGQDGADPGSAPTQDAADDADDADPEPSDDPGGGPGADPGGGGASDGGAAAAEPAGDEVLEAG